MYFCTICVSKVYQNQNLYASQFGQNSNSDDATEWAKSKFTTSNGCHFANMYAF